MQFESYHRFYSPKKWLETAVTHVLVGQKKIKKNENQGFFIYFHNILYRFAYKYVWYYENEKETSLSPSFYYFQFDILAKNRRKKIIHAQKKIFHVLFVLNWRFV